MWKRPHRLHSEKTEVLEASQELGRRAHGDIREPAALRGFRQKRVRDLSLRKLTLPF